MPLSLLSYAPQSATADLAPFPYRRPLESGVMHRFVLDMAALKG